MFIVYQNAEEEEEALINYFVIAELPSAETEGLGLLHLSCPFLMKSEMPQRIPISHFN
jgi:hypothetical protein